jgi:RHS repeat-associated protein
VQNLHYTYDPAGNITHIQDDAQQTIYFRNQRVEPSNDYTYDALYRLIQASGREHQGQGGAPIPHSYNDAGRTGILSANPAGRFAANDAAAMGTYIERYVYDAVGNFLQMQHRGSDPAHAGWTRRYNYGEASLTEPGKFSNRLSGTTVGTQPDEVYAHDTHGNMLRMPQLAEMQWDYKDQMRLTRRQRVNAEDIDGDDHHGERTFYVYDAAGQRIRKVCEKAQGLSEERIYLGGFEIFRKHGGAIGPDTATLERETLHVMDDKQRIALVETRTLDSVGNDQAPRRLIRYQFGNHLGSASLELDEQAQIISYEEYSPYGSSTYQAVRSQTETVKRYRYTGRERDEESAFIHNGARYYIPWLGRWSCSDPSGLKDGPNLFVYATCRPTVLFDPSGLEGEKPPANSPKDVAQFEAREAAFEAGKKLETGDVRATTGGKELPPPTGSQLDRLAGNSKTAKKLRLKYATKQGVVAGQALKENVTARSSAAAAGSKDVPHFGTASQKLVPEVGFNKGRVISVGKNPGGEPAGARTTDLAIAKEPIPPANYEALKGQKGSAVFESTADMKLGGGRVPNKPGFKAASGLTAEELAPGTRGLRLPKGAGTTLNAAGGAMVMLDAMKMAREQHIAEQGYERIGRAVLDDAGGEYFIEIKYGLIFNDYTKTYISGPMAGTTKGLGFFEMRGEVEKRNEKYGYWDWKGDFVPGKVAPVVVNTRPGDWI